MFASFADQIAAGARPLFMSQLTLWSAINQRALDGAVALAALNMDTTRQSLTDVSAAFRLALSDKTGEPPAWIKVFQLQRDLGGFALYGREVSNICAATQSDIVNFMQQGAKEAVRDMPSMFKNTNIDSPAQQVPGRKKSGA